MITVKRNHPFSKFTLEDLSDKEPPIILGSVKFGKESAEKIANIMDVGVNHSNNLLITNPFECPEGEYKKIKDIYYRAMFRVVINVGEDEDKRDEVKIARVALEKIKINIAPQDVVTKSGISHIEYAKIMIDPKSKCIWEIEEDDR